MAGLTIRPGRGRKVDYTLRLKISEDTQPVAVALIEAKAEDYPPTEGLQQAKHYGESKRFNVPSPLTALPQTMSTKSL